ECRNENYKIAIINYAWIVIQNLFVGIFWKQEHSFAYPAPVIMIINAVCPTLQILGSWLLVNHFLVLTQLLCYLSIFLAGISITCMIIVCPQMNSFLTKCNMGFPSEDCRIYDIHYMW
ncbi:hypothetical protein WA171_006961, partial [Blastocystis sp. BT1]